MRTSKRTHDGRRLAADAKRLAALHAEALDLPSLSLEARQADDLELLLGGALDPLDGFATQGAFEEALAAGRWPLTLDVAPEIDAGPGARLALRDREGTLLAVLSVASRFVPDRRAQAARLLGSVDERLRAVRVLTELDARACLGGAVEGVMAPRHEWFRAHRAPAHEVAAVLAGAPVLAVPVDGALHRQQLDQAVAAARGVDASLLVLALVGEPPRSHPDPSALVRALAAWTEHAPIEARLAVVPYAPRWSGACEAPDLARLARNYGATHVLVGGDLESPRQNDGRGIDDEALEAALPTMRAEGAEPIVCPRWAYQPREHGSRDGDAGRFVALNEHATAIERWSEPELRAALERGLEPPGWLTFDSVLEALREAWPIRRELGLVVLFTGLSGSGKSTLATRLAARLAERGGRRITLLDGDEVREHLSSGLGFSREDRDLNVRRIGYVAAEIARHGGTTICAPIAPYARTRRWVRERVEAHSVFVEIHVATPLDVCEARDPKGLYVRARRGEIAGFTGIDDPYEVPEHPEMVIDTGVLDADAAIAFVLERLATEGLICSS